MLRKAMSCWSGTVQEKYAVKDENTGMCEVAVVPVRRLPAGNTAVVTGDPPLVHVLVNILASQHVYMLTSDLQERKKQLYRLLPLGYSVTAALISVGSGA